MLHHKICENTGTAQPKTRSINPRAQHGQSKSPDPFPLEVL